MSCELLAVSRTGNNAGEAISSRGSGIGYRVSVRTAIGMAGSRYTRGSAHPTPDTRHTRYPSPAFSLVELMVVIGIISLLIAIALPAFAKAREAARKATTSGTINAISTGIEQFRTDEKFGGQYPQSNLFMDKSGYMPLFSPHLAPGDLCIAGGASLVVWALAGADLQGTPGFRDLNHIDPEAGANLAGFAPWADDTHHDPPGLYAMNGSQAVQPRSSFVDVSKLKFPKNVSTSREARFHIPSSPDDQWLESLCFLDAFDQPILYYRASPGRAWPVSDQRPEDVVTTPGNAGVYNINDNRNIAYINSGLDFGAGTGHFKSAVAGSPLGAPTAARVANEEPPRGSFFWTLYNPSATVWATHNPETYILLSPGPDGLFGTPDDIGNFPANK